MIAFDEAVALVTQAARPLGSEQVRLADAHGRVLATPVIAQVASPPADVSTMDGYAVQAAAPGDRLTVIGQSFPGAGFAGPVAAGTAVRIFTGAPVPSGADRVVIQEDVRRESDVAVIDALGEGSNIRSRGSDFDRGHELLPAGTMLSARALVAAAAADLGMVVVHRRPRVRLIATGDELAEPGNPGPATIPDSVSVGVMALARDWGGEPVGRVRLRDDLVAMADQVPTALAGADLVVVTGGASVGERDFARAMFGDALALIFSTVAMKPGKPVWLGRAGETLVMGLPGNPTSALVTARLLLAPLLAGLTGRDPSDALRWRTAPLAQAIGPTGDRETLARAVWAGDTVRVLPNQDSGAQRTLALAELLVRLRPGVAGYAAGDRVDILNF